MLIIYDHLPINNHIMQGLQAMHEKMHHGSVLVELHTGWKIVVYTNYYIVEKL